MNFHDIINSGLRRGAVQALCIILANLTAPDHLMGDEVNGEGKKASYIYGPFGGKVTYARGPLGGEAKYGVPGRMQVASIVGDAEFSLVKFILIESGDKKVKGFEEGYVEMGGFLAFAVESVMPPSEADANAQSPAAVLWKGIEIVLPGPAFENQPPKFLTGNGEIGVAWNLNLLLDVPSFDFLWPTKAALPNNQDRNSDPVLKLGATMACTMVYRNHRRIEGSERREFSVRADRFRESFTTLHRNSGGRLAVDLNGNSTVAMMRQMGELGVIEGIKPGEVNSVSEAFLYGLFSAIRKKWLKYELESGNVVGQAHLVVQLKEARSNLSTSLDFIPGEWVPTEEYKRMPVEIREGGCTTSSIHSHGFARETSLELQFIPRGNWSESGVTKLQMLYELGTPDKVIDSGNMIVQIQSDEPQVKEVKSVDKRDVRFRCKLAGYWKKEAGKKEQYVRIKFSKWSDARASMRSNFHFILPESLQPPKPVEK